MAKERTTILIVVLIIGAEMKFLEVLGYKSMHLQKFLGGYILKQRVTGSAMT